MRRLPLCLLGLVVIGAAVASSAAVAAVSISRAELSGTRLRIEGRATANSTITVDGVAMGTSDAAGNFRIERDPFAKPADCTVAVNDGSATPTATFTVTTQAVQNSQSAVIIATAGGTSVHAIITAWTPFHFSNGSIAILPGGNGSGRVTSQPAGIDCTLTRGNGAGACTAFFAVGTVVRLDARPSADSQFLGFRRAPGCFDASKLTVARGTTITCQPVFSLR